MIENMATIRRTLKRFNISHQARYLTFSCYHRLPLFQNDKIKQLFVDQLELTHTRLQFKLFAWVIMPEHVHLLVIPNAELGTISHLLRALKRPVAANVLDRWRELGAPILGKLADARGKHHFWLRGGGYDRNIYSEQEMVEKIGYIHENPVRRGLVKRAGDWTWSSAGWYESGNGLAMDVLPV